MTHPPRVELEKTNALLKAKLLHLLPAPEKRNTAINGLSISRYDAGNYLENSFYKPLMGVIVQGSKRSLMGSEHYIYSQNQCVIVGVDIPSAFYITDASPEHPFLGLAIELDKQLLTELAMELPPPSEQGQKDCKGVSVADADPAVLDAFLRLLELLEQPEQIPFLAALCIREIHYRILMGPQGEFMRMLHTLGTQSNQIAQAVSWMRTNYKEPLQVEALAQQVNMATSTFHHHFKKVTTVSPLQFHKRLRLYEAKRLMLEEHETAGSACLAVGYESQTQFTREYKQMFGESPSRNVKRLQCA